MQYLYQYLIQTLPVMFQKMVPPPLIGSIIQWLLGNDGGETLDDKLTIITPEPDVVDVPCLISTGSQTLTNANIVNGAIVTNEGTAIGTATAGFITFTAGTISQVSLDGVLTYACCETAGFPQDVSGAENHITAMTTTWTTADDISCYPLDKGFAQVAESPEVPGTALQYDMGLGLTSPCLDWGQTFYGKPIYSVTLSDNPWVVNTSVAILWADPSAPYYGSGIWDNHWIIGEYDDGYSWYHPTAPSTAPPPATGWLKAGIMAPIIAIPDGDPITAYTPYVEGSPAIPAHRSPALADGSGYAANGELLTNVAGTVSNDAGCKFLYADPEDGINTTGVIITNIKVTVGSTTYDYPYIRIFNEHPRYKYADGYSMFYDSSNWVVSVGGVDSVHPTSDGMFPPKTGYPTIGGLAVSVDYDCWWIDDTVVTGDFEFVRRDHADWLARANGADDQVDQWKKLGVGDNCHVAESVIYNQGTIDAFTEAQYKQAVEWSGDDDCGAGMIEILRDVNGDIVYDSNGEIVFTLPS